MRPAQAQPLFDRLLRLHNKILKHEALYETVSGKEAEDVDAVVAKLSKKQAKVISTLFQAGFNPHAFLVSRRLSSSAPSAQYDSFYASVDKVLDKMGSVPSTFVPVDSDMLVEQRNGVEVLDPQADLLPNDVLPLVVKVYDGDTLQQPVSVTESGSIPYGKYVIPHQFVSVSKPHQLEGVQFLLSRLTASNGALVAHAMGLGKTLTCIAAVSAFLNVHSDHRLLVCCPKSMLEPWLSEMHAWPGVTIPAAILPDKEPYQTSAVDMWLSTGGTGLLLTHGAMMRIKDRLTAATNLIAVLDEAHLFKNPKASLYPAFDSLPTARRILLSGTPIQNSLSEFHDLLHLAAPGLLGSASDFWANFASEIETGMPPTPWVCLPCGACLPRPWACLPAPWACLPSPWACLPTLLGWRGWYVTGALGARGARGARAATTPLPTTTALTMSVKKKRAQ